MDTYWISPTESQTTLMFESVASTDIIITQFDMHFMLGHPHLFNYQVIELIEAVKSNYNLWLACTCQVSYMIN